MVQKLDTFYQEIDRQIIDLALGEDLGPNRLDCTNQALFKGAPGSGLATLISKDEQPVILCGLALIQSIFSQLDSQCTVETDYTDGDHIPPQTMIARLHSNVADLLTAERTILNFIRHLSAIATLTRQYVDKVKHTTMKILDTRKTTPGLRHLEKYAVQCGGGVNHRMGLYDVLMVKDTHIDLLGGIDNTLKVLSQAGEADKKCIIEIRTREELMAVLQQQAVRIDRVLLDNMSIDELYACVEIAKSHHVTTEASGNICLENVAAVAETGVDYASIGRLTYAAGQVDLAMKV